MITFNMKLCITYPQHWSKLDTTGGPSPPARHQHAACCIAGPLTGQEHPLLLVGGGLGEALSVLQDMWVLDVDREMWSEVSAIFLIYDELHQKCVLYIHPTCCSHTCGCVP